MQRLIREELGKCYYREGVNHLEKCGKLRGEVCQLGSFVLKGREGDGNEPMLTSRTERYFKALKEGRVTGYMFEQQNYIPKEGGN